MRTLIATLTAAGMLIGAGLWLPSRPGACLHLPATYEGSISQSTQEGILFFHDGTEDLILKADYQIAGEALPENLAWVLTVPTEPDNYQVVDASIFKQTFDWAEKIAARQVRNAKGGIPIGLLDSEPDSVELGKRVKVGPYDIQPVRARGKEALDALNAWFDKNGYSKVPPERLKYFVDNNFTFLAVKITPEKNQETGGNAKGELQPLHLSFKTDKPYYPLKFFAGQGDMSLRLYVLTTRKLDYAASAEMLKRLNHSAGNYAQNVECKPERFPEALKKAFEDPKCASRAQKGAWHLNIVNGHGFNKDKAMRQWDSDVFFAVK